MKPIGIQLTREQQLSLRGGVDPAGTCTISCKDKDNTVLGSTTTTSCNTGSNVQKCKDAGYDKTDSSACSCGEE